MEGACGWRGVSPTDLAFVPDDLTAYFTDKDRKSFIIKVNDEVAGFVLLNQICVAKHSNWHMGEFFVIARFQGTGVGRQVARQIWKMHPGVWEVSIIPRNKSAFTFWERVITDFTRDNYTIATQLINQSKRTMFTFDTHRVTKRSDDMVIGKATESDLSSMHALSYQKRRAYEKAQPQFWRWAGEKGEQAQKD